MTSNAVKEKLHALILARCDLIMITNKLLFNSEPTCGYIIFPPRLAGTSKFSLK
jgi:hypothetical protein